MNTLRTKTLFLHMKSLLCLALSLLITLCLCSCKKQTDYFDYVSELRANVFLAETEEYKLRIYSVKKETPYQADGTKKQLSTRTEIFFRPISGDKTCNISFTVKGNALGGEMSYDNVKTEYYFSCGEDTSSLPNIPCQITYGEEKIQLNAMSVLSPNVLTPKNVLNSLIAAEQSLFSSLTDKYGFAGEIYIRLIFEDAPFYYVGVIDKTGKTHAFLLNATSGKVLAKRHP